jgi:hypothetical protein
MGTCFSLELVLRGVFGEFLVAGDGGGDVDGDAAVADPGAQVRLAIGLVRVELGGLRRRGPWRERMTGIARTRGMEREGVAFMRRDRPGLGVRLPLPVPSRAAISAERQARATC